MSEDTRPVDFDEIRSTLGEPRAAFAPDPVRLGAGIVACVVAWAIGMAMVHRLLTGDDPWILLGLGVALSLIGSWTLRWVIKLVGLKVLVYPEALIVIRLSQNAVFPWDSLVQVRQQAGNTIVVTRNDGG